MIIKKLDPFVANKIAAGEVVERPSAVVKELVENAVDAGATQLTIEIKDAGKALIRVSDNGSGISPDDLMLAFERHATSKIDSVDDIYRIATLGFRGEALASIASVSRVECITKTEAQEAGIRVHVNGGVLSTFEAIGTNRGTTMIVRDLFYNTPVRFKFLKSNQAEQTAIVDLVNKLALSHPQIAVTLLVDGRELYRTDGRGRLVNSLLAVFGRGMVDHLVPVEAEAEGYTLSGLISKPSYTRGNRNYQMLFVNGRYVKSEALQKTIYNCYKGLMTIGQFPAYALHLTLPFDHVDVNIHPSKTEVRFKDVVAIEGFVFAAIKNRLMSIDLVPKAPLPVAPQPISSSVASTPIASPVVSQPSPQSVQPTVQSGFQTRPQAFPQAQSFTQPQPRPQALSNQPVVAVAEPESKSDVEMDLGATELAAEFAESFDTEVLGTEALDTEALDIKIAGFFTQQAIQQETHTQISLDVVAQEPSTLYDDLRIVGQLFDTYIVAERGTSAYLIDQHAAHERVLFETFLQRFRDHQMESQLLLVPFVYTGDVAFKAVQERAVAWLEGLGVAVEPFGDLDWVVRAVPLIGGEPLQQEAVTVLLDAFQHYAEEVLEAAFVEDVIRQSCKAAIKANHRLTTTEITGLLKTLKHLDNPYTCPHGRPIIVELTAREIEKRFKRT